MRQPKSLFLARWGALGALAAYLPGEVFNVAMSEMQGGRGAVILLTSIWTAILAVGCFTALVIGQNRYLRRPLLDPREAGVALGGGAVSGAIAGLLAEVFFQAAVSVGDGNVVFIETARILAWGIFGGLTGLGMSFVIPNLGHGRGPLAGLAGGAVGALGFIFSTAIAGDAIGRLAGMTILGTALGFAIGLVEEVARSAWLEVQHGRSGETVKVSLGPELVCVGSNSQRCAIWARGARPIAFRFRYIDGKIVCDDMGQERTTIVDPGSEIEVGNVRLRAHVGGTQAGPQTPSTGSHGPAARPSPPSLPKPIPPPARIATAPPRVAPPTASAARGGRPPPPPPPPPPPSPR